MWMNSLEQHMKPQIMHEQTTKQPKHIMAHSAQVHHMANLKMKSTFLTISGVTATPAMMLPRPIPLPLHTLMLVLGAVQTQTLAQYPESQVTVSP